MALFFTSGTDIIKGCDRKVKGITQTVRHAHLITSYLLLTSLTLTHTLLSMKILFLR